MSCAQGPCLCCFCWWCCCSSHCKTSVNGGFTQRAEHGPVVNHSYSHAVPVKPPQFKTVLVVAVLSVLFVHVGARLTAIGGPSVSESTVMDRRFYFLAALDIVGKAEKGKERQFSWAQSRAPA